MVTASDPAVTILNALLRDELSASMAYARVSARLDPVPFEVVAAKVSHARRSDHLRRRVRDAGAVPASGGIPWRAFARALGIGDQLSTPAVIQVLAQAEEQALSDYHHDLEHLEPGTRELMETVLLPEQRSTRDAIVALHQRL